MVSLVQHRGALGLSAVIVFCHLLLRIFPENLGGVVFLVPGNTLTRPWMLLTCNLVEDSLLNLVLSLGAIAGASFFLAHRWDEVEAGRYLLLVGALQASLSWVAMVSLYILFREHHFLFVRLGGLTGLVGALSVAVAQQVVASPSSVPAPLLPALRYAPLVALCYSLLLLLLTHAGPPDELFFSLFGILAGWTYLRYYQPRQGDSLLRPALATGDSSEAFAFAQLWPPPLQPPLRLVGAALFGALSSCSCGLFPPSAGAPAESANAQASDGAYLGHGATFARMWAGDVEAPPPSVTTADPLVAERRRQRARELLEQRMAAKVAGGVAPTAPAGASAAADPPDRAAAPRGGVVDATARSGL